MAGVKFLRRLQVGKETTDAHGTAVAATARLHLNGLWEDTSTYTFPETYSGYIGGVDSVYIPNYEAQMSVEGEATFEEIMYILDCGVAITTPTTDSGSGYIWTYTFPTTAQNEIRTFTVEGGDDQAMEEAAYAYCSEFTLSGEAGGVWNLSATLIGRQIVDTDSFTTSSDCTFATVEQMLFQKSKLYIDVDTDTIGTTQKTSTFLDATLSVRTGWRHVYTGDGNLYFTFTKCVDPEVLLEITFEHDSTATAEKTAWRTKTPRLIQILCQGTALGTAGTYTYKSMIINLAGVWEKFDVIGERDGNDICHGTFRARYNADSGRYAQIVVVNEVATLP